MVVSIYALPAMGVSWNECKKGDITDCFSYEYEKYFCGVGTFTMELPVNTRFGNKIDINSILVTDSGDELIVKNIKTTSDRITVTGYDLNGILLDRVTLSADSEDGTAPFEGSTEACVKYYVESNFVSSADPERNLPRFAAAENTLDRGVENDHALPRLQNVAELVTEMCNAANLGWRVKLDTRGADTSDSDLLVFDVEERVDRSANQSERNRVMFSVQFQNVSEVTREVGITSAKNVVYCDIGGTVVKYARDTSELFTSGVGYGRQEEYCSLSGDSLDPDVYKIEAEQNISDRMEETNSLVIDAGSPLDYGTLYDVGTIVTAYGSTWKVQLDSVIASVKVRRTATEYSVTLTLGESKPKLLDGYQKKNDATQKAVRSGGSGSGSSLPAITSITINSNTDYTVYTNTSTERYIAVLEGE